MEAGRVSAGTAKKKAVHSTEQRLDAFYDSVFEESKDSRLAKAFIDGIRVQRILSGARQQRR